ncbi:hypothetical protein MAPG_06401 [Magnaporthiopsis poae ATCC 64411]|uniref:Uncharacterized protein n=1 Tax=Magnaporthiopsis poae (strain ATCC 64411 / 73-15) TaxID=644358 RepID=A0A0C4E1X7_MAGP6|nr:hypothetical protein MAPG_06401 [Magnaporthiopsis poae ATCC 64411]
MSSPPRTSFASIAFHASDKLRFFQFPEAVHRDGARHVIQASWPDGIQAESAHVGSAAYEYKRHVADNFAMVLKYDSDLNDGEGTMIGSLRRELQRLGLHAGGQATMDQGGAGVPAEPGYEFKLQRPMWRVETGERVLQAQTLTLRIVEVLDSFGWKSYATVRQREGVENFIKTDTWYFINTGV